MRIPNLVSNSTASNSFSILTFLEGNKLSEDTEERLMARLGITYGVLRKLGFSEEKVEKCIRCIDGVDLDEAFDWVGCYASTYFTVLSKIFFQALPSLL